MKIYIDRLRLLFYVRKNRNLCFKSWLVNLKLLIIVNVDWFFYSHRLPIAYEAKKKGYEVHIATSTTDISIKNSLVSNGFNYHEIEFDRSGKSFLKLLNSFLSIVKLLLKTKPDILHLVTIQPVIYGGIAAKILGINKVVYAISGLGHIFISNTFSRKMRRRFVLFLYKLSLSAKNRIVIFQNPSDEFLIKKFCSLSSSETVIIPGSGVNLEKFFYTKLPKGIPTVLMASRLLISKGVREFAEAGKILKARGFKVKFKLVGQPDYLNPLSIDLNEIKNWEKKGYIEYLGYQKNIHKLIQNAHLVVLPSYYPEGLPKVLCEAAASGRTIITTDKPGCRDSIEEGITGIFVKPQDPIDLAEAIFKIIKNDKLILSMSTSARLRAEKLFCIKAIVAKHIDLYNKLSKLD